MYVLKGTISRLLSSLERLLRSTAPWTSTTLYIRSTVLLVTVCSIAVRLRGDKRELVRGDRYVLLVAGLAGSCHVTSRPGCRANKRKTKKTHQITFKGSVRIYGQTLWLSEAPSPRGPNHLAAPPGHWNNGGTCVPTYV